VLLDRAPLVLIDLDTKQGVTGWLRAAALAEAMGTPPPPRRAPV
jgi:hypothetical protein